jgi:hypothetical protein
VYHETNQVSVELECDASIVFGEEEESCQLTTIELSCSLVHQSALPAIGGSRKGG